MQRLTMFALLLLTARAAQAGDLTLTRSSRLESQSGRPIENVQTMLIHGGRSRMVFESMWGDNQNHRTLGPHIATVMQCDTRHSLIIDLDHELYSLTPLPSEPSEATITATRLAAQAHPQPAPAETLTIVRNVVDSGEQRPGFGRTLRHYRIHEARQPSAGANARASEGDAEGWYVEIPEYEQLRGCNPLAGSQPHSGAFMIASSAGSPINYRIALQHSGPEVLGYPSDVTTVAREQVKEPDGTTRTFVSTSIEKITELSTAPLDPSMFDIPPGFTRVDHVETGASAESWSYRAQVAWARFTQGFYR